MGSRSVHADDMRASKTWGLDYMWEHARYILKGFNSL